MVANISREKKSIFSLDYRAYKRRPVAVASIRIPVDTAGPLQFTDNRSRAYIDFRGPQQCVEIRPGLSCARGERTGDTSGILNSLEDSQVATTRATKFTPAIASRPDVG